MIIGTANGRIVVYNELDSVIRIKHTDILMVGAKTKEDAIEMCKRNLVNFIEAQGGK